MSEHRKTATYFMTSIIVVTLVALFFIVTPGFADAVYGESFVPSITSKGAPNVLTATDADGTDVSDKLLVTPFSKKDCLTEKKQKRFEEAYDSVDEKDLAQKINEGLSKGDVAVPERWEDGDIQIKSENLSVTDIFYVHEKNDSQTIKLGVELVIESNIPENQMVAILYYGENGWGVVPCTRDEDGNIHFTVMDFGPYMVVTNTVVEIAGDGGDVPASPQTGVYENFVGRLLRLIKTLLL